MEHAIMLCSLALVLEMVRAYPDQHYTRAGRIVLRLAVLGTAEVLLGLLG